MSELIVQAQETGPPRLTVVESKDSPRHLLTTRAELMRYAASPEPEQPQLKSYREVKALSETEARAFRRRRRAYFGSVILRTPAVLLVLALALDQIERNRDAGLPTAKCGLALNGFGHAGKTTILCELLRRVVRREMEEIGAWPPDPDAWIQIAYERPGRGARGTGSVGLWTPVGYFGLAGSTLSVNAFIGGLYRSLGLDAPTFSSRHDPRSHIDRLVEEIMPAMGILVFMLDEIQLFSPTIPYFADVYSSLKGLINYLNATVILAGQRLDDSPLLTPDASVGGANSSTARRFRQFDVGYYAYVSPNDKKTFAELINLIEGAMGLANQEPGELAEHAALLHRKSSGCMGTLMNGLGEAASFAMSGNEPSERITEADIHTILWDAAAARQTAAEDAEDKKAKAKAAAGSKTPSQKAHKTASRSFLTDTAGRGEVT